MTIATMEFSTRSYRSGKIRIMNMVGTAQFRVLDVQIEQRRLDMMKQWGVDMTPPPGDDGFTWDKFLQQCLIATAEDINEVLAKWGNLTQVTWPETIQVGDARVVAAKSNDVLRVEKVMAVDTVVGPVDYFVITTAVT